MLDAEEGKHHTSYLKRKRCLRYAAEEIGRTLSQLCRMRHETKSQEEIKKIAFAYAQNVEAACTKSRAKISNEDYRAQFETKTRSLCNALIKQMAPTMASVQYQPIVQQQMYSYACFPTGVKTCPPLACVPPPKKTEPIKSTDFQHTAGTNDVEAMMNVKVLSDRSSEDLFVQFANDFATNDRDDEMYIFQ